MASKQIPMIREFKNMLPGIADDATRAIWRKLFYQASVLNHHEKAKALRSKGDTRNEPKTEKKVEES